MRKRIPAHNLTWTCGLAHHRGSGAVLVATATLALRCE